MDLDRLMFVEHQSTSGTKIEHANTLDKSSIANFYPCYNYCLDRNLPMEKSRINTINQIRILLIYSFTMLEILLKKTIYLCRKILHSIYLRSYVEVFNHRVRKSRERICEYAAQYRF